MEEKDERIKKAAAELGAALTAGGKDYWVSATAIEITTMTSAQREFAWVVSVEETAAKKIAP